MNTNQSSTQEEKVFNPKIKTLAWFTIFIITAPQIIYRLLVPRMPGEPYIPIWISGSEVALLAILGLATCVLSAVKPLRGFVIALLAIFVGYYFILPFSHETTARLVWIQEASWGIRLVVKFLVLHSVLIVVMGLTLIGSGIGRKELFLVRGNPSALFKPIRFLSKDSDEPKSWTRFVLEFLPYFVIICGIVLAFQIRPSMSLIYKVLVFLPAITAAAAINAFGEEFEYRSMLLARLEPVLGGNSAILISSAFFGLMHYLGGTPGGPLGVLLTGALGFLMAKSMIDTRGLVWAFLIHFVADFMAFSGSATLT